MSRRHNGHHFCCRALRRSPPFKHTYVTSRDRRGLIYPILSILYHCQVPWQESRVPSPNGEAGIILGDRHHWTVLRPSLPCCVQCTAYSIQVVSEFDPGSQLYNCTISFIPSSIYSCYYHSRLCSGDRPGGPAKIEWNILLSPEIVHFNVRNGWWESVRPFEVRI